GHLGDPLARAAALSARGRPRRRAAGPGHGPGRRRRAPRTAVHELRRAPRPRSGGGPDRPALARAADAPRPRGADGAAPPERPPRSHRVSGRALAHRRRAHPGAVRPARHAAARARTGGVDDRDPRPERPARSGDRRSREFLAHDVPRSTPRAAGALPEACLARGSLHGHTDQSTAAHEVTLPGRLEVTARDLTVALPPARLLS